MFARSATILRPIMKWQPKIIKATLSDGIENGKEPSNRDPFRFSFRPRHHLPDEKAQKNGGNYSPASTNSITTFCGNASLAAISISLMIAVGTGQAACLTYLRAI